MISKIDKFKILGDKRGQLIALEGNKQVPFNIKRVFYIYGTQTDISRGNHSHYQTKQYLVAINGSCQVTLDDGKNKETFNLDRPNIGLFQDALIWGSMHNFSDDCILLVMANSYYDPNDYITSYSDYLKAVNHDS